MKKSGKVKENAYEEYRRRILKTEQKMSEKFDSEIEKSVWRAAEELEMAMNAGDYKKANKLMIFLEETKKAAEMAIESKKDIDRHCRIRIEDVA